MSSVQELLEFIGGLLNDVVVPFIVSISFLFFIWNAFRYFILGGTNPEDQEKAKTLAVWGIAAFVVMVGLWGMVNILVDTLNFGETESLQSDYVD